MTPMASTFLNHTGQLLKRVAENTFLPIPGKCHVMSSYVFGAAAPPPICAARRKAFKRKSATLRRFELRDAIATKTNLKQRENLLRKAQGAAVKAADPLKAAKVTDQLHLVLQKQRANDALLQKLQKDEDRSCKKAANRRSRGVVDWTAAAEGYHDITDDTTDWESSSGPHLQHVLPADTLLCRSLRLELIEINQRELQDVHEACCVTSDTFVGMMSMAPTDYLRARKAYCALLRHKGDCLCKRDINIVTAVVQADQAFHMKGLMKHVGIDPNVVSLSHFQERLVALPLWSWSPPDKTGLLVHWVVVPKEEGLDYKAHSRLLTQVAPVLRPDIEHMSAEKTAMPREDLKALRLMCSTKRDGRILEAAVLRGLSNTQMMQVYGKNSNR
jgi:hypothetical protein